MPNPPVLWDIESEPALATTKLIAEAWDAAGLYQVGSFIGDAWKEWNGHFRDDVRSFFRGEEGTVRRLADRMLGSPDVYGHKGREAEASVNFVTCHDGFSLNDLVSYDRKHNEANGESNRDGADDNRSWNCGVEGPTDDAVIEALRSRQVKNFTTVTLLSLGMPMILMGDEVRRTQGGNNNAYCHDNEASWFDWTLVTKHADIHRFVRLLIERRSLRELEAGRRALSLTEMLHEATTAWHGVKLLQPDWSPHSHSLAFGAELRHAGLGLHLIMNAYWEHLDFDCHTRPSTSPGAAGSTRRSRLRKTSWTGRSLRPFRTSVRTMLRHARSSPSGAGCPELTPAHCHEKGFHASRLRCRAPARPVAAGRRAGAGWRRSRGRSCGTCGATGTTRQGHARPRDAAQDCSRVHQRRPQGK
jgi:glycogen operon protein